MKRKDLLLLTVLLTQTTSAWAMWSAEDEQAIKKEAKGLPWTAQRKGFKTSLPAEIHKLNPSDPLPKNLGTAKQIVSCKFGKESSKEIELPTEHLLYGDPWIYQEDLDHTQSIATLNLSVQLPKERPVAYKRQIEIQHTLLSSEKEVPGWNYFNGDKVYQARTKLQHWLNQTTGKKYDRTLATQDGKVLHHQNHEVIYVEPFAFGGNPSKPKDKYRGEYKFKRDLNEAEKLSGKKGENLLYSDGKDIYFPHVSQELWEKNSSQAGFFIGSYKKEQRLNFIPGTTIQGGKLPEGLYQLMSVQDVPKKRIEKWQRLGEDAKVIEITTPVGVSSIPGMGGYAPRVVSDDVFLAKTLKLQRNIEDIIKKTEEAKSLYPHAKGVVIVLGKTGSGKTTLINGLAGGLKAQKDEDGILRLYANNLLPGFHIGHDLVVGTKVPGVWHDPVQDILYWDCPGFGDVRGAEADIVNAFAINRLFTNANVKVVLVAQDSDLDTDIDKGQGFLKLLEEMTQLFTNEQQLKDNLSLVVTKGTDIAPDTRLNILQKKVLSAGTGIKLTDKSKNILSFLHTAHSRVNALPKPQKEGSYTVSDKITTSIHKAKFVPNPQVNFKAGIRAEAKLLAGEYGQALDQYLTTYMKTEGAQRIINYCAQEIDQYTGKVSDLRVKFGNLLNTLEKLPTDSRTNFVNGLKKYIDVGEINKTIENLRFLQTIKESIKCSLADWKTALLDNIREKFKNLTAVTTEYSVNNNLLIKGVFLGMSDVTKALEKHPTAQMLTLHALNTIFLSSGLEKPGLSVSFVAPKLKVLQPITINLSGKHGKPGAPASTPGGNGSPGGVGGNGGNFCGLFDIVESPKKLTIKTSGGNGGKGGNAGNGANGKNGVDGALSKISSKSGNTWYYQDQGKNGDSGQNSGQRGQGGLGGFAGSSIIKYGETSLDSKSSNGSAGSDGKLGVAGKGGVHGRHCQGTLLTGLTQQVEDLNRVIKTPSGDRTDIFTNMTYRIKCKAADKVLTSLNDTMVHDNILISLSGIPGTHKNVSGYGDDSPTAGDRVWQVIPSNQPGWYLIKCPERNTVLASGGLDFSHSDMFALKHLLGHESSGVVAMYDDGTYSPNKLWKIIKKPDGKYNIVSQRNQELLQKIGEFHIIEHKPHHHIITIAPPHWDDPSVLWEFIPVSGTKYHTVSAPDQWQVTQSHQGSRGNAPNGRVRESLNMVGLQKPLSQVSLDTSSILKIHNAYREKEAATPNVAPFIKVFPK